MDYSVDLVFCIDLVPGFSGVKKFFRTFLFWGGKRVCLPGGWVCAWSLNFPYGVGIASASASVSASRRIKSRGLFTTRHGSGCFHANELPCY